MKMNKSKLGTFLDYLIVTFWLVTGVFSCVKAAMSTDLITTSIYITLSFVSFYFTANTVTKNIYKNVVRKCFYEETEETDKN